MLIIKATPREEAESGTNSIPAPFIVGAGRSGTTLLRLMLDAHSDLAIPPETHFVGKVNRLCRRAPDPRACFIETITSNPHWPDFHMEQAELERSIDEEGITSADDMVRCFYLLYAHRFGKSRWGDKTPDYLPRMAHVQDLLPEAHFIHVVRDGRDVALSITNLWFGPDSIQDAAVWWVKTIEQARSQVEDLRFYREVRYEDLVSESDATLRGICDFIDLPWDDHMLEYYAQADDRLAEMDGHIVARKDGRIVPAEQRRAIHELAKAPPRAERIGRWQQEMREDDRRCFESVAGGLLKELGYDVG